jgi:RNA polymerase sigma factor (sigma-70 family)
MIKAAFKADWVCEEAGADQQALRWLRMLPGARTATRTRFARWVMQSPVNLGAYLRQKALSAELHGIDRHRRLDVDAILQRMSANPASRREEEDQKSAGSVAVSPRDLAIQCENTLRSLLPRWATRSRQTEAELIQDVYLLLLRSNATVVVRDPRAYLRAVVHHVAATRARREKRSKVVFDSTIADSIADSNVNIWRDEPQSRVAADQELLWLMRQLPQRQREVLIFCKLYEMTYREVAKRLNVSPETVKKRLAAAIKFCHELMTRDAPRLAQTQRLPSQLRTAPTSNETRVVPSPSKFVPWTSQH